MKKRDANLGAIPLIEGVPSPLTAVKWLLFGLLILFVFVFWAGPIKLVCRLKGHDMPTAYNEGDYPFCGPATCRRCGNVPKE